MKTTILKYFSVFGIYFIIDASYQFMFGIKFSRTVQEEAGISDIFATDIQNPVLILIWFILMTIAIVKLAVEPAVEAKSIKRAAFNGLLLGLTAYATLALPNGWSIVDYPIALVLEVVIEGMLFSPAASIFTTWWLINKANTLKE